MNSQERKTIKTYSERLPKILASVKSLHKQTEKIIKVEKSKYSKHSTEIKESPQGDTISDKINNIEDAEAYLEEAIEHLENAVSELDEFQY